MFKILKKVLGVLEYVVPILRIILRKKEKDKGE